MPSSTVSASFSEIFVSFGVCIAATMTLKEDSIVRRSGLRAAEVLSFIGGYVLLVCDPLVDALMPRHFYRGTLLTNHALAPVPSPQRFTAQAILQQRVNSVAHKVHCLTDWFIS